ARTSIHALINGNDNGSVGSKIAGMPCICYAPRHTPFQMSRVDCFRHCVLIVTLATLVGCASSRPGTIARRTGDEIVVAGQFVHTGTRVVLWMDPGGYDAYRVDRRFASFNQSSWETSHVAVAELKTPNRYGLRRD